MSFILRWFGFGGSSVKPDPDQAETPSGETTDVEPADGECKHDKQDKESSGTDSGADSAFATYKSKKRRTRRNKHNKKRI